MGSKVLIMMATYNGEKYISKQLDSICNQTYHDWNLIISDDGSKDKTKEIIQSYAKKEPRILCLVSHKSDYGASSNFYFLLENAKKMIAEYDYYLFSDQDDIWRKDKIEKQVDVLSGAKGVYACYSDLTVMNAEEVESCRMSEIQNIRMKKLEDIFFNQIYIWGNTLAFTKALMELIYIPQGEARMISHDHYIGFYASAFGKNIYIDEPLVMYRRYDTNVSDMPRQYNFRGVINKILNSRLLIDKHAANYAGILYFIRHSPNETFIMRKIKDCYQNGGFRSLKIMKELGVVTGTNKWNSRAKRLILLSKAYKRRDVYIRILNI